MKPQFQRGDVVQIKGQGRPVMTVSRVFDKGDAFCYELIWFNGEEFIDEKFDQELLSPHTPVAYATGPVPMNYYAEGPQHR